MPEVPREPAGRTPFPEGFLWGASTAAHQIEGNSTNNDFWALENAPNSFLPERSGDACDSLHRWPEDLDLVASLGLTSYRFSLEWSRIVPSRGHVSRANLAFYRRMIDGCLERGIVPVVTVHHFTNPRWFAEAGGWQAPDAAAAFLEYVEAVVPILGDVPWVCTINEPNIYAMMTAMLRAERRAEPVAGALPPPDPEMTTLLIDVHHRAGEVLRAGTDAKVGWTIANQNFQAEPGCEELAAQWAWSREYCFIDAARGDDWIGVQAYTRVRIGAHGALPAPDGAATTLSGWEVYPAAAALAIRHTAQMLPQTPIVVSENGIATSDDDARIAYTRDSLRQIGAAIADGLDVRGYLHWSLLDNFEWGSWAPTFGLVEVDRQTFERRPKPSAAWLGSVARSGGATL